MYKSTLILTVCSLFLFEQCKLKKDTECPVMLISTPQEGVIYIKGQKLNVKMNFTDNDELHHTMWTIQGKKDKAICCKYDRHIDNSDWSIDTNILITDTINTEYIINIECEDHSGNITKKEILFNIK